MQHVTCEDSSFHSSCNSTKHSAPKFIINMSGLRGGRSGFDSRQGLGIFLFATASTPDLEPTLLHIKWEPGVLSPRVKRPGREADHSRPSSAEVKNVCGAIPPFPQYVSMVCCLVKHRDNLI
jgi:hypothetical protein